VLAATRPANAATACRRLIAPLSYLASRMLTVFCTSPPRVGLARSTVTRINRTPFPVRQPSKYLIQLRSPILKRRPQCMPTRATLQCVGTPIAAFACDFGAWVTGILLPCHLVYLSARGTLANRAVPHRISATTLGRFSAFREHPCRRTRRHDRFGSVIAIFGADQHSSSFPTSTSASRERRIENRSPPPLFAFFTDLSTAPEG
jgi:hypothetical protein